MIMYYRSIFIGLGFLFPSLLTAASGVPTVRMDYINTWKEEAIYQMVIHRVPASITLAQAILESGDGNSRLAREGNNHFGIKCHSDWTGDKIYEDDETKGECFRKYEDANESFEDHSLFLKRKRYESLFQLDVDDYKGWAKGLKECGYATNPKYPQLLIGIIEEFGLHAFDEEGTRYINKGQVPAKPTGKKSSTESNKDSHKTTTSKSAKNNKDNESAQIVLNHNRNIELSDNRIKYVLAGKGDSPESIAKDLDLNTWLIRKYNDLGPGDTIREGQAIYIQPKRSRGTQDTCKVQKGDTLWSISQKYGVKLKKLCKLNGMDRAADLIAGKTLKLRK
jgi:LysM repeat protein